MLLAGALCSVPAARAEACANEPIRTEAGSSFLPDCRAYELVTPADSNGRLVEPIFPINPNELFPTEMTDPLAEGYVYQSFDGAQPSSPGGTGTFDVYEAKRTGDGWETAARLSPDGDQAIMPTPGGLSSDHRYELLSVPGVIGEPSSFSGTYIRTPDGSFERLGVGSLGEEPLAQGRFISAGASHIIFSTGIGGRLSYWCSAGCTVKKLQPDAPASGTGAIYDRSLDGPTQVISLLPGDITPAAGEDAYYQGAAANGEDVAFSIGDTLYVRVEDEVTRAVHHGAQSYAGFSEDGRFLFYESEGDVHRFDTSSGVDVQLTTSGDAKIVNISNDGSHVYFISDKDLGGPGATTGKPNMYCWCEGTLEYVATVAPSDLERTSGDQTASGNGVPALGDWIENVVSPEGYDSEHGAGPGTNASRSTTDGTVLAFESRAALTPYDSAGHTEIYRFDARDRTVTCVSCNPTVAAPVADAHFEDLKTLAWGVKINNLSVDGQHIFFETSESLAPRDRDGVNDVYEWSNAAVPSLALLSSGESVEYQLPPNAELPPAYWQGNRIFAITPSGSDVFFGSTDRLLPYAPAGGVQAIYDARIGGGFPLPSGGEACAGPDSCHPAVGAPPAVLGSPRRASGGHRRNACRRRGKTAGSHHKRKPSNRRHRRRSRHTCRKTHTHRQDAGGGRAEEVSK